VFGGAERFGVLLDVIAGARASLQLYFYAFGIDDAGRRVVDALIEARDRGVAVTLLVDGFGTLEQPDTMFVEMAEAGINFARFEPRYGRRYLLRNHQKMPIASPIARIATTFAVSIPQSSASAMGVQIASTSSMGIAQGSLPRQ
jgi:cardiolipin synthase